MQGLFRKLTDLDSDAERGVRLVEFFDQLVVHGADLEAVVRATAVLVEATAGTRLLETGSSIVIGPDGVHAEDVAPRDSLSAIVKFDDLELGTVWIERPGGPQDWDELILERMALAVATTMSRAQQRADSLRPVGLSDPALIQLLIDNDAPEVERSRAVRLLGFLPGQPVDVIALETDGGMHRTLATAQRDLAEAVGRHMVVTAISDTLGIVILSAGDLRDDTLDESIRVCIGDRVPVEQSPASWAKARSGVRFASLGAPWSRVVRSADLGCLLLLCDLPQHTVRSNPDFVALSNVAAAPGGLTDMQLLRATFASNSLRETARALHMHHSSAEYRLGRLARELGFDPRSKDGRERLGTALTLWRLHRQGDAPRAPA